MLESPFKNVAGQNVKCPQNRCFAVNIAKFLILLISKIIFLSLSMVHHYIGQKVQGLDCKMASDFWDHRSIFLFLSRHEMNHPQDLRSKI